MTDSEGYKRKIEWLKGKNEIAGRIND